MMNKTKSIIRVIAIIILIIGSLFILTGCTEVDTVSYNIRQQADNFDLTRRLVVYNSRTDKMIIEIIGTFSVQNNTHDELEIICDLGDNVYRKHFIYLNENTIYTIEDITGKYDDKYHYEVNYYPETIRPITENSENGAE